MRTVAFAVVLAAVVCAEACAAGVHRGSPISEYGLAKRTDILYFEDFETDTSGGTTTDDKNIVKIGRRCLKTMYKQGGHGTEGKPKKHAVFGRKLEKIFIRRYIMFEPGFDFAAGGKVDGSICFAPGKKWVAGFGGKPSHGNDGFSCRLCWMRGGAIIMYTYHADMKGKYGEHWGGSRRFTPGQWQCIELMIQINTIDAGATKGNHDGVVRLWVDGETVDEHDGIRFRDLPEMGLDNWEYGFYFGGTWTCPKDQYIYMDNIVVATDYIGPAVLKRPKPKKTTQSSRPTTKPDPLAPFAAKLGPVKTKAAAAEFPEAVEQCTGLLVESIGQEGFDALRAYAEGLAAGAELKNVIVERAGRAKPTVFVEFGGRPLKAKLLSADADGLRLEASGNAIALSWRLLAPRRFYGIAAKLVSDTSPSHLLLARYCAAMRLRDEARAELARVGAGLAEEVAALAPLLE